MLQKKTNWLTNSNAKSHTGWQEKHSIHCSNSALGHFVKRGMGEDSIKYSWETNFLNEAQDCCSLQLASHKYCLEDFVRKYCCCYLCLQYSKMVFDWLKQINCYLSEEWTKDRAKLFKSGTQISGKESKWNLCLKSVQSLAPSLPAPTRVTFLSRSNYIGNGKSGTPPNPLLLQYRLHLEYIGIHLKCNLKTFEIEGACSSRGACHLILLQRQQRAFQKTPFGFLSQAAEFTPHRKTMTMSCREFKICISEQCEQVC